MKKILLFVIPCILLNIFNIPGIGVYLYRPQEYYTISYQPGDYTLSSQQLDNPYQGWYQIYGYVLSDTELINVDDMQKAIAKDRNQLVLVQINLLEYPDSEISALGLSQLETVLLAWRDAGKQIILRFLYDWDGKARETEPKDISIIKRHMEQTGEIVNKYAKNIYLLQGIYVGNCGEMNNSNYMSKENLRELAAHLHSIIDPDIYLSVRTPEHYRIVSQSSLPISGEDAFSGEIAARTGLFNDGMLGSANDLGTYGDKPFEISDDFSGKGTRSEEIAFQNSLCDYVPNGGEVVLDNEYNDFANAVEDLKNMHVSYLDSRYDLQVLDKWRNDTYHGDDCFDGADGYSYIGAHLGYRYAIRSSDCSFDNFHNTNATLSVTMENSGFSAGYRPFLSTVTIVRENGSICDIISVDTDNRLWKSGETATWTVPLDIRTYQSGNYQVYYRLYDPASSRNILLANETPAQKYGYYIGSFTVEYKAPSKTDTPELPQ